MGLGQRPGFELVSNILTIMLHQRKQMIRNCTYFVLTYKYEADTCSEHLTLSDDCVAI